MKTDDERYCFDCQNFHAMKKDGDYGACIINEKFQTILSKYHEKCKDFRELFIKSVLRNET